MITFERINIRGIYISLLGIFYVLWGASWDLPSLSFSTTDLFYFLIFFAPIIFFNKDSHLSTNSIIIYIIYFIFIATHLFISYLKINNDVDLYYSIIYTIKLTIIPLTLFSIPLIITSKKQLNRFLFYFSLTFVPVYLYLHWLYRFYHQETFVGVIIEPAYSKVGVNSFGFAIAFIVPFLISYLYINNKNKLIILITLIVIFVSTYFIESRAMAIVIIAEVILLYFITSSLKMKRHLFLIFVTTLILSPIYFSDDIKSFFYKRLYDSDRNQVILESYKEKYQYNEDYFILNTHRGWLLYESVVGAKDNRFVGNGIGTFRVRESNQGSKTETHNDWSLILYETGLLGVILLLGFLYSRLHIFYFDKKKISQSIYIQASLSSILGLMIMMFFTNFITTGIFWFIISLNLAIVNYEKKSY